MLARLPHKEFPAQGVAARLGETARPLAALTTRAPDDPGIALLDAWAVAADVLTFYQERIANEGYLRTAGERRSVLELARLIGYELNPGVAATAYLAFEVENPPAAPAGGAAGTPANQPLAPGTEPVTTARISHGTRVQSLPESGEQPRTYETSVDFTAHAQWNALRPRLVRPQRLALHRAAGADDKTCKLYLLSDQGGFADEADASDLAIADTYLLDPAEPLEGAGGQVKGVEVQTIYVEGTATGLKAGQLLLLAGQNCTAGADGTETCNSAARRVPYPAHHAGARAQPDAHRPGLHAPAAAPAAEDTAPAAGRDHRTARTPHDEAARGEDGQAPVMARARPGRFYRHRRLAAGLVGAACQLAAARGASAPAAENQRAARRIRLFSPCRLLRQQCATVGQPAR